MFIYNKKKDGDGEHKENCMKATADPYSSSREAVLAKRLNKDRESSLAMHRTHSI